MKPKTICTPETCSSSDTTSQTESEDEIFTLMYRKVNKQDLSPANMNRLSLLTSAEDKITNFDLEPGSSTTG